MKTFFLFLLVLSSLIKGYSQSGQAYSIYRLPLNLPAELSSMYGEIRLNHFHYGIDYRTGSREGLPVTAIADGYVSRIKIDEMGYGRAIYVDHPATGHTSVYAHLSAFPPVLSRYVLNKQYEKQSFVIDLFLEPGMFPVRKGDTIGFSGNSGGSTGPHLHFEIRDRKTQDSYNILPSPLLPEDTRQPVFTSLYLYPCEGGKINGNTTPVAYRVIARDSLYVLDKKDTIKVCGKTGIGISAFDYLNNSTRHFSSLYRVKLWADNKLVYHHQLDRLAFNEVRYINSIIDYDAYLNRGLKIYRLYRLPGNHISSFYRVLENDGYLTIADEKVHKIECEVEDIAGNRSKLIFYLSGSPCQQVIPENQAGIPVAWNEDNVITLPGIKINIPKNALYENLSLLIDTFPRTEGLYSKIFSVHTPAVPIHTSIILSIAAPFLPDSLQSKACVIEIGKKGEMISWNGKWEAGMVQARIRNFGKFAVTADTTPPSIVPVNISPKAVMSHQHFILFRIKDTLSGIQSYNGYIDGKWALFEYDPKKNALTHYFDSTRITFGQWHKLKLVVTDNKENKSIYEADFLK